MDSKAPASGGNVMVVCRVRPMNASEIARGAKCCLDFNKDGKSIAITMATESA